ncbi:hypothetical protein [Dysgonomonas sp. GY617]|uniref:hypothetical protein n=1 Tax=Dysgonomonas sp. GY617 TaxID=2780420 RepID=UPI001F55041B|nr:hypothetical protein [Dysgonomonas sp. GY617]
MRTEIFTGSFNFKDIARVQYSYYALRHLPHNTIMDIKVTPLKDTYLVVENILKTPSAFMTINIIIMK